MHLPVGASSLSGLGGQKTNVTAVSNLFHPLGFMKVNHAAGSVAKIISIPNLQERLFVLSGIRIPLATEWVSASTRREKMLLLWRPKIQKRSSICYRQKNANHNLRGGGACNEHL